MGIWPVCVSGHPMHVVLRRAEEGVGCPGIEV